MNIYPIHNLEELEAAQEKLEELLEEEIDFSDENDAMIQLLTIAISDYKETYQHSANVNCASNLKPQPAHS
ncbi:hypothetical protein P0136_04125 [Lentisphaerota bacterium ZTH]|nr:hypothetical protein JYG24_04760 [Lentisphaerota bacterium]WET07183.1 hypothetical protein P0136_04125 [Lentisphaerota bacterium ZTH]